MFQYKALQSGDDLNNYKGPGYTGCYVIVPGVVNSPANYCWVFVIGGTGTQQVAFEDKEGVYIRAYTGAPIAWTAWKKITPNEGLTSFNLTINTAGATGSASVYVYDRVATITGTIHPTNAGVDLSLAWIPDNSNPNGIYERFKPMGSQWLSCNYYKSNISATAEAKMDASGILKINIPIADVDLKISGTWITKG